MAPFPPDARAATAVRPRDLRSVAPPPTLLLSALPRKKNTHRESEWRTRGRTATTRAWRGRALLPRGSSPPPATRCRERRRDFAASVLESLPKSVRDKAYARQASAKGIVPLAELEQNELPLPPNAPSEYK